VKALKEMLKELNKKLEDEIEMRKKLEEDHSKRLGTV
jgi:hypothetical protein